MTEKLKDYQVLDVLRGGTFYKVRHKVTNNIFTWKAYNCSAYSEEQIQLVADDVKTISKAHSENVLRYYDTIFHSPSKTLYFVVEHNSWRSLEDVIDSCKRTGKYLSEGFIWYVLHELARICRDVQGLRLGVLQTRVAPSALYLEESGELRIDCFELRAPGGDPDLVRQVGETARDLYRLGEVCGTTEPGPGPYSEDLRDVLAFLDDHRSTPLHPDVLLHHPTVLSNLEMTMGPKNMSQILLPMEVKSENNKSDLERVMFDTNKCDSQKAVELRKVVPAPRCSVYESPIYCNINPLKAIKDTSDDVVSDRGSLSPTIAALALELPGFVPRSRKALTQALDVYNSPQKVTERALSHQWMSRLIALRQREASLNKRERDLISKEIVNSPAAKMITLNDSASKIDSNGITLPAMISHMKAEQCNSWVSRRQHHRRSSVRARSIPRRSINYDDHDQSLSAASEESIIVTATKFTKENMPRRNIFPEVSTKKVHFTAANPFVESDDSVTLTFYELDKVDSDGYQLPKQEKKVTNDISKFKYLDLEKITSEKRAAMQPWSHSSPSKQAKISKQVFADITNNKQPGFKRTPSKSSIASKMSSISAGSHTSSSSYKSCFSMESGKESNVSDRTRSSVRQSLAPFTPAPQVKKPKGRMSLLPFKTPFKFMSSK